MKKQIKRLFISILTLCLIIVPLGSVSASAATKEEMMPYYNNTESARITTNVDDNGKLTISYRFVGYSSITTKVVITTYIEKKTLGLFWTRVDNGQPDKQWVDTIYDYRYIDSRTYNLSSKGTYRITAKYKVYGNGGSADEITCQTKVSY